MAFLQSRVEKSLIAELERLDGCTIFDPHVVTIEDGGMKQIDGAQIAFKQLADPYGLMNPGKTRGWSADMARSDDNSQHGETA